MARLINADKLEADMYHNAFEIDTDLQKWDSGCWIRYKMFENVMDEQPTVDVEPVRHGHWVRNDNGTYSCSECHSWIPNEQHYYARYCLFCGAKMDLGKEDGMIPIEWIKKWAKKNGLDCYDYDYPTEKNDWWYAIEKMLEDWENNEWQQ